MRSFLTSVLELMMRRTVGDEDAEAERFSPGVKKSGSDSAIKDACEALTFPKNKLHFRGARWPTRPGVTGRLAFT